ncbi:MAG: STAS domain-containing protein [Planctomycetes bacterium]|nr:STAS domain-containing protein [Planctomycetota bacterium]
MTVKLRFDKRVHPSPSALIFELRGEVSSDKSLEKLVAFVEESDQKDFVISMKDVHYINSSGFGELADLHLWCEERGKSLLFVDLPAKVASVFETMGGRNFLQIYASLDAALEAIRKKK